jgi:hypothetical protein
MIHPLLIHSDVKFNNYISSLEYMRKFNNGKPSIIIFNLKYIISRACPMKDHLKSSEEFLE